MDERLRVLLLQRSVRCNIRKSPQPIPTWFKFAVDIYNTLYLRSDKKTNDQVRILINELFTLLKYVALRNPTEKRLAMIEQRWPSIKERVDAL